MAKRLFASLEEQEEQAKQQLVNTANNVTSETPEVIEGEKASNFSSAIVISAMPLVGKDLDVDTDIRIPDGWKRMGDIQVGDKVMTKDGSYTTVTGVYPQGKKPTWRITFRDGRWVNAGLDHQWKVWCKYFNKKENNGYRIMTTRDIVYIKKIAPSYLGRLYIDLPDPEQNEDKQLPMHPYILGCFIGDGVLSGSSVTLHMSSLECIERVRGFLDNGYKLTVTKYKDEECYVVRIVIDRERTKDRTNKYVDLLQNLGYFGKTADRKFIPKIYLNGSAQQKLELLRGLMDTDGEVGKTKTKDKKPTNRGTPSYSTSSFYLANDICSLVRSLGGLCSMSYKLPHFNIDGNKIISYNISYRMYIRLPNQTDCCTRPERLARLSGWKEKRKLRLRIENVAPYTITETQCISVDHPSELYVCGDYIVTHNTSYAAKHDDSKDLESSLYSRKQDNTRNEEFPGNYINMLKYHLVNNNWKYIFVACHQVVRDALKADNIKFYILYPTKDRKEELLNLARERGNHEDFIKKLDENWDAWISALEQEPNAYALGPNEFISDELFDTKLKFLKQ